MVLLFELFFSLSSNQLSLEVKSSYFIMKVVYYKNIMHLYISFRLLNIALIAMNFHPDPPSKGNFGGV